MAMKLSDLVAAYIKARDKEAELKAVYDKKKAPVVLLREQIEAKMLQIMNAQGSESIRTTEGTAYKSVRSSCTVADREAYFTWIMEDPDERMVFLENRANKTAVEQYKTENADIPPGVNWSETVVVNFNRS